MKKRLTEQENVFVSMVSSFVNGRMSNANEVGAEMANDHRYLVNEKAKIAFGFLEELAFRYENGEYDERDEWACSLAAAAIQHLEEEGMYCRRIRILDRR